MSRYSGRDAPEAGSLAFTFVALVLGFTGLGYLLDRWLHTAPWLMVSGVFVGAAIGLAYMVLILFAGTSGRKNRDGDKDDDVGPDERPS